MEDKQMESEVLIVTDSHIQRNDQYDVVDVAE